MVNVHTSFATSVGLRKCAEIHRDVLFFPHEKQSAWYNSLSRGRRVPVTPACQLCRFGRRAVQVVLRCTAISGAAGFLSGDWNVGIAHHTQRLIPQYPPCGCYARIRHSCGRIACTPPLLVRRSAHAIRPTFHDQEYIYHVIYLNE